MKSIVTVRNLSKTYRIGQLRNSNPPLRDAFVSAVGSHLSFLRGQRYGDGTTLHALQDVSLDEIVAFSEVARFLDTAVKYYSSGMYLRLAFAIAAHLRPEVLLLDEVLAVGDKSFQEKCLAKIKSVSRDGRTVFFVSHSMEAIAQMCGRVFLIRSGQLYEGSDPQSTIAEYLEYVAKAEARHTNLLTKASEAVALASA
jgi:ABC-type multidrug transport system ATPase subunit